MSLITPSRTFDVRALPGTREVLAYKDGGLFPVLAIAPSGAVVAVLRGGAGHLGIEGRMDVVRSLDAGLTWSQPAVVADSDRDDRNPALGVSAQGTLILAYHSQGNYDDDGKWSRFAPGANATPTADVMVTRSRDGGLTWQKPFDLGVEVLRHGSAFGKIVALADGKVLMPIYDVHHPSLLGSRADQARPDGDSSYLVRSRDDGVTWGDPSLIAPNMNETGLAILADGSLLAVMRGADPEQALWTARSDDGGFSWSGSIQVTGPSQHPADLVLLANGDVLLVYGNRNVPYAIEGRVSRDGGRSWLDLKLAFSGSLYGYNVEAPRRTDSGYPSSVVVRRQGEGRGVTMYYYNPALKKPATWQTGGQDAIYLARDYVAIAVCWSERELIEAVGRATG